MTNIHELYQETLSEILRISDPEESKKDGPFFPGLIAVNSDGGIITNEKIEKNIIKIADFTQQNMSSTKSQYSNKEWRALVRKAFGPFMLELDSEKSVSDSAKLLKKFVEGYVQKNPTVLPVKFHTFGCTLFDKEIVSPIKIGPVVFETKHSWIMNSMSEGKIKKETGEKILNHFKNGHFDEPINNIDSIQEKAIFDVLVQSQLSCTVETRNLGAVDKVPEPQAD